jgi:hypothetical protein
VARALYIFWGVEALVIFASGIDWLVRRNAALAVSVATPDSPKEA